MRLDFIRPLYERRGPYASVYLGALTGPERETHWRSVRDRLAQADHVGKATLDALEDEALRAAAGRALFATHGEVVLAESLPEAPSELAAWTPLPHVTPMLIRRGENVPHLRVIVDHAGAELAVYGGGSPRRSIVEAASWPLQKTAQGGWSQRRYENAVEGTWEKNAIAVAQEIDEQVRRIGAELILVAGEPKSRSYLLHHLGTKAADRVTMVEHGSREDHGQFEKDVERALDDWLARRRAELLERHQESDGPTGMARVSHALREGRVHALLLPGELPAPVWIGEGGTQLATDQGELRRWGVADPVRERSDSALVRAAAMTDAELWFTDAVKDVAAVLRY
ncbi:baeRF2 domain-containing protein [Nonomuraea candida]|uniref:baeRF2 domain-containing protein n=1 Tax=Nonomuraea candida TaxID=359159 RepID=UPI0005BE921D|nr:Vms1/Ankzf1 family peptidyl-tRNA hydrolase [Nonomuraea candida]